MEVCRDCGGTRTLPKVLRTWLNVIDMGKDLGLLPRACILGSARILKSTGVTGLKEHPGILASKTTGGGSLRKGNVSSLKCCVERP